VRQGETVKLRPKFVSLAFDSWQEVMQYMMIVRLLRYNIVAERFVIFIKLFGDTWSGLSAVAVVNTFASADKSVQFVDVREPSV